MHVTNSWNVKEGNDPFCFVVVPIMIEMMMDPNFMISLLQLFHLSILSSLPST